MKALVAALAVSSITIVGCERKPDAAMEQSDGLTTSIQRQVTTPSGDWGGSINYTYGKDGNLRHISYEFRTVAGYDKVSDGFKSTRCMREYDVSETGELLLRLKKTTDLSTGEAVERGFYEPKFTHWMTLTEAQKEIQAEQAGRGDGDNPSN